MMHGPERYIYIYIISIVRGGKERSRKRGGTEYGQQMLFFGIESVQYRSRYNIVNKKHVSSAMPEKCNNIVARRSRSFSRRFLLSQGDVLFAINMLDNH